MKLTHKLWRHKPTGQIHHLLDESDEEGIPMVCTVETSVLSSRDTRSYYGDKTRFLKEFEPALTR